MLEIELKFQIAESRRHALIKLFDAQKSEKIHLQAKYYDTAQQHLAKHGVALRQRLEGGDWIQTLKAATSKHFQRFEHNYVLGEHCPSTLDLSIYQEHPEAQQLLKHALAEPTQALRLYFETDIQRRSRCFSFQDSEIEVCLDIGEIRTLHATQAVYEIEFELKSGQPQDLFQFSMEWVKKYQLWLDVRSKAELGHLLAQGLQVSPAQLAVGYLFNKKASPCVNLKALVANQLQHLMPHIAAISAQVAEPAHYLQANKALTHLYYTLSLFKPWSADLSEQWAHQLGAFKQQFEHLQHLQHMQHSLAKVLHNPNTAQNLAQDIFYATEKLTYLVRSAQNVQHFLDLFRFSLTPQSQTDCGDLKTHAQLTLQQQYKQLQANLQQIDTQQFDQIQKLATDLHALQFSFPLLTQIYDVKNLQKYSKHLNEATTAADEYLVLYAAADYLQHSELEPSDWFVLGWLAAKQEMYAEKLIDATEQFLVSRKFLKL